MRHVFSAFCMLFCFCGLASGDGLMPQDFARGMILETHGDGPFFSLEIPVDIYRGTQRKDLGDLRVFNAADEPVPHILKQPGTKPEPLQPPVSLPFFPVFDARQEKDKTEGEKVSLQIHTAGDGTIIDVETEQGNQSAAARLQAVLLDLSHLANMPAELALEWTNADENFVTSVSVDGSPDLSEWTRVVSRAGLAEQYFSNHRLYKNRIALKEPHPSLNYLRINWPADAPDIRLTRIEAIFPEIQSAPERRWCRLKGSLVSGNETEVYVFDAKGAMPVDRVNIHLPEKNSLIRALIKSRPTMQAEWRERKKGFFYSLSADNAHISNDVLSIARINDRYWRIEVISGTAGPGNGAPELEIGWIPHRLLFLARGKAPFTLAYGSGGVGADDPSMENVLYEIEKAKKSNLTAKAETGRQIVLGGDAALQKRHPQFDWKTWLLWAILIIGVFFLGFMALRLYRQMNPGQSL